MENPKSSEYETERPETLENEAEIPKTFIDQTKEPLYLREGVESPNTLDNKEYVL